MTLATNVAEEGSSLSSDVATGARPQSPPLEGGLMTEDGFAARYEVVCELGKGAFGRVVKANDRVTGEAVVIKSFLRESAEQDFIREMLSLKRLDTLREKGFLCMVGHGAYIAEKDGKPVHYLVTTYEPDVKPLNRISAKELSRMDLCDIATLFSNVARQLQEVHRVGLAHRDIKPGNILVNLETKKAIIIDFGLSCPLPMDVDPVASADAGPSAQGCQRLAGTPTYCAPESFVRRQWTSQDLRAMDAWGLGFTMAQAIAIRTGKTTDWGALKFWKLLLRNPTLSQDTVSKDIAKLRLDSARTFWLNQKLHMFGKLRGASLFLMNLLSTDGLHRLEYLEKLAKSRFRREEMPSVLGSGLVHAPSALPTAVTGCKRDREGTKTVHGCGASPVKKIRREADGCTTSDAQQTQTVSPHLHPLESPSPSPTLSVAELRTALAGLPSSTKPQGIWKMRKQQLAQEYVRLVASSARERVR